MKENKKRKQQREEQADEVVDTQTADQQPEAEVLEEDACGINPDAQQIPALDEKVQQALAEAMQQVMDARAYATRTQMDFDNFRRRNANTREEAALEGKAAAATAMLPVLDNMQRALDASENTSDPALREGVQLIYKQLCDAFAQMGVEEIPAEGQPFDPQLHHAVLQEEGGESGMIAQVMQKGYRMGERVLRYTMVKVFS